MTRSRLIFMHCLLKTFSRLLGVRWMLSIEEKSMDRVHRITAEEDFIFTHHNLTARWNDLYGAPSLSKCKNISLSALTPLLYDSSWKALENRLMSFIRIHYYLFIYFDIFTQDSLLLKRVLQMNSQKFEWRHENGLCFSFFAFANCSL